MRAAVVDTFGTSPRYGDVAEPTPTEHTEVATVLAAAVKNLDRLLVSGSHYGSAALTPPFTPGIDGVVQLADGRLAYTTATLPHGLMAERTLVDPAAATVLPAVLDPVLAAAIPNAGLSSWFALEYAAAIQPGQTVVILGATGVTGATAVQLAKSQFGAGHVVALGRNAERLDWLRTAGADETIVLDGQATDRLAALHAERRIDAVLDYLWGPPAEQVLGVLGNSGLTANYHRTRFVQIGSMAGPNITLPAEILRSAGIELIGTGLGSVPPEGNARAKAELLPKLFELATDGRLRIDARARPLSEVTDAWDRGEPTGSRVVLVP